MHGGEQDRHGDERFDRLLREAEPAEGGGEQGERVAEGEGGDDLQDFFWGEDGREEQDEEEKHVVRPFPNVIHTQAEHRGEAGPQRGWFQADFERGDATGFVVDLDDADLRVGAGGDDGFVGDHLVENGVVVECELASGGVRRRGELELRNYFLEGAGLGLFGALESGCAYLDLPRAAVGGEGADVSGEIGGESVGGGEFEFADREMEGERDVMIL